MTQSAVGLAWYTRDTYDRCMSIFDDADDLPDSYDDWIRVAEVARNQFRSQGQVVVEAVIDPDTFLSWCEANGQRPNKEGRMHFANVKAYEAVSGKH